MWREGAPICPGRPDAEPGHEPHLSPGRVEDLNDRCACVLNKATAIINNPCFFSREWNNIDTCTPFKGLQCQAMSTQVNTQLCIIIIIIVPQRCLPYRRVSIITVRLLRY